MNPHSTFRAWLALLVAEIFAGVNAATVFRIFERATAGYVAGFVFLVVGIWAFQLAWKKSFKARGLAIAVAGIYSIGFSLPLVLARLTTPSTEPVQDVFGLPLEVFHRGSETSFMALVIITVAQIYFAYRAHKAV